MSDIAVSANGLGKMYRLYRRPADKVLDAFGLDRWMPWRKNYYQEFWAVRDLDLTVRKGERVGLIGRNGAGKSTLLKLVCGNITPSEGAVKVAGRIQALMELGTGFHPEFTGRQNIRASLAYQGLSAAQIRGKEEDIVDFAEVEEFINQPIKTYSAGMYARLAFATATAVDPEILIIDEVLGAGDAYFAGKCQERMRNLTEKRGATVFFVSHDLGSIQQMCGRALWIERGGLLMDGSPLDVTKAYYAAVLQQEEARLRAANQRLARRRCEERPSTSGKRAAGDGDRAAMPDLANNVPDSDASLPFHAGGVAAESDGESETAAALVIRDRWCTPQATFVDIVPIDCSGQVKHVFRHGEDFGFRIVTDVHQRLASCWIAVVLYDAKGNLVISWNQRIQGGVNAGRKVWRAMAARPPLRQGEYIASLELLPDYDPMATDKLPFYCHWNRAVTLKIDEQYLGHVPLGTIGLAFDLREEADDSHLRAEIEHVAA